MIFGDLNKEILEDNKVISNKYKRYTNNISEYLGEIRSGNVIGG